MKKTYAVKSFFCAAAISLSACSCVTEAEDNAAKDKTPIVKANKKEPHVSQTFQDLMEANLIDEKAATHAYGFFSEGGWGNAGQVWILTDAQGKAIKTIVVGANKRKKEDASVSSADATKVQTALSSAKSGLSLKDIKDQMMDGLSYEFVALEKSGSQSKESARVFIRTYKIEEHPQHKQLVDAFLSLIK